METASAPGGGGRIASVEALRLVAMFEIVSFHTSTPERLPLIGGLGLPIFLMLTTAFSVLAASTRGTGAVARVKLRRLGGAWLFWSAFYGAHLVASALRHGTPPFAGFEPAMLLYGTADHLWFAPFAIATSIAAAGAQSRIGARFAARHVAVSVVAGLALAGLAGLVPLRMPFGQWMFALPAVPLGFAIGAIVRSGDRRLLARAVLALAFVAILAELFAVPLDPATGESLRRYGVATPLALACFLWPGRAHPFVRRLAACVPGVYFVHVLIRDLDHPFIVGQVVADGLIVFGLSLLVVDLLRRTPLRGVLLLPEALSASPAREPASASAAPAVGRPRS